jgi:glycosyltransferase involved in cell wall biosynthesis
MCTYNGGRFLSEQLKSIVTQTRLPDGMIVVDDCSSDASVEIVREFQRCVPFTIDVVVNPANLGFVKNFEKAISLCSGDIIVLADQDDLWKRDKLAKMEQFFIENTQVDAVFSNAELVDETLRPYSFDLWSAIEFGEVEKQMVKKGNALQVLLRRNVVTGATLAFRHKLKDRLLPIPESWVHDEWLATMIAATGSIGIIPDRLICYRQHGTNQLGIRKFSALEKLRLLFTKREDLPRKLLEKNVILRERLAALLPADHPVMAELDGKVAHMTVRATLRPSRVARLAGVVGELFRGHYSRYSLGWKSMVRDLVAPL